MGLFCCANRRTEVHRRFPQWRESVQFARSPPDEPFSGPLHRREMPVNALICLILLRSRDNRDSVAERVEFEHSVTFWGALTGISPEFGSLFGAEKKILNQREFLGSIRVFESLRFPSARRDQSTGEDTMNHRITWLSGRSESMRASLFSCAFWNDSQEIRTRNLKMGYWHFPDGCPGWPNSRVR